jgi:RecA/RadA recombinase
MIYGPAAIGKTTLAIQLAKEFILKAKSNVFWFDTEFKFSSHKFNTICPTNVDEKASKFDFNNYLLVSQPKNLQEQRLQILKLQKIVPHIKNSNKSIKPIMIVIDSMSYHLRFIEEHMNFHAYSTYLERFMEDQIYPLLQVREITNGVLIFTHQMTNTKDGTEEPAFHNLFGNIDSVWIKLEKQTLNNEINSRGDIRLLKLFHDSKQKNLKFQLVQQGIKFYEDSNLFFTSI